jgi:hypothetical protein
MKQSKFPEHLITISKDALELIINTKQKIKEHEEFLDNIRSL